MPRYKQLIRRIQNFLGQIRAKVLKCLLRVLTKLLVRLLERREKRKK